MVQNNNLESIRITENEYTSQEKIKSKTVKLTVLEEIVINSKHLNSRVITKDSKESNFLHRS